MNDSGISPLIVITVPMERLGTSGDRLVNDVRDD